MGRIIGIDVARCLALLGMISVHLVGSGGDGPGGVNTWFQITAGRSAALFAVLAGVSIALTTRPRPGASIAGDRLALVSRALLIALIGIFLGIPDSGVAVILTFYGLLFLVAVPVTTWSARSLAFLALGWAVLSPIVSIAVRRHLPGPEFLVPTPGSLTEPLTLLRELTLTGYYPVLTWATYLFAGMAIGRLELRSAAARRWLLVGGAWLGLLALAVARLMTRGESVRDHLMITYDRWGPIDTWSDLDHILRVGLYGTTPTESWSWLWVWSPHSGSIVDLVHTVGTSMLVIGASLLLVAAFGPRGRRAIQVAFGAGTMTLTLYVGHVLLASAGRAQGSPGDPSWMLDVRWHLIGALVIGAAFALARLRGPLEWLVSQTSSTFRSPR